MFNNKNFNAHEKKNLKIRRYGHTWLHIAICGYTLKDNR
jgi:hypothetical protein